MRFTRYVLVLLSIGLVAVPAAYGAEQPAGLGHGDSAHSESGHSHLAVFLGAGEEDIGDHQESAKAVGIVYEYRFRNGWDIGAALERLELDGHANTIALIPAGYTFRMACACLPLLATWPQAVQPKTSGCFAQGSAMRFTSVSAGRWRRKCSKTSSRAAAIPG